MTRGTTSLLADTANGPGHRNAAAPVTVYIINDPAKASVNRCKPTNTISFVAGVSSQADSRWMDGCDMHVENSIMHRW